MIKEIFIISPTDVYPYIDGQKQLPSPQSQANANATIKDFNKSQNQDNEKAIIVLGGNGHSNKEYLEQKNTGLGAILGKTEAELISEYIEDSGIPKSLIYIEKNPSFNTIDNAMQAYEVIKDFELSENSSIKLFAWHLGLHIEQSSHAERAEFTYKKIWKLLDLKFGLNLFNKLNTEFIFCEIGNSLTNSQSHLQNTDAWLKLNNLAWIKTFEYLKNS